MSALLYADGGDIISRDLAALLFSRPLIAMPGRLNPPALWPAPASAAGAYALLARARRLYRAPKSRRLGARFEALVCALIQAGGRYAIVRFSFPGKTKHGVPGEGDLLLKRLGGDGHYLHAELTVKYYFAAPGRGARAADWHGGMRRDRLDRKLAKLIEKQTRLLSRRPAYARTGKFAAGLPKEAVLRSCVLYRGGFYYAAGHKPERMPPCFCGEYALSGVTLAASASPEEIQAAAAETGGAAFAEVTRKHALSPLIVTEARRYAPAATAFRAAAAKAEERGVPVILAALFPFRSGGRAVMVERKRLYVMPSAYYAEDDE